MLVGVRLCGMVAVDVAVDVVVIAVVVVVVVDGGGCC